VFKKLQEKVTEMGPDAVVVDTVGDRQQAVCVVEVQQMNK